MNTEEIMELALKLARLKEVSADSAIYVKGDKIRRTYFKHGIETVVYIHISPADLAKLKADSVGNLIVTGHVASDSVGINPLIRELEERNISVTRIGIIPS